MQAANLQTAINGFKKTGIYPFDRNVFTNSDFAPSETTERPIRNNLPQQQSGNETRPSTSNTTELHLPQLVSSASSSPEPRSYFAVPPREILPVPHEEERVTTRRTRARGKTAVLTSPEYILELEQSIKVTNESLMKKKPRQKLPQRKSNKKNNTKKSKK